MPTPPKGYTLDTPTKGTPSKSEALPSMNSAPLFIRNSVDMSKVRQTVGAPRANETQALADVRPQEDPYSINVFRPDLYKNPDRDHEITHVFQETRNPQVQPFAGTQGGGKDNFDYGGQAGLEKARLQGKTISHFNAEQQAEMVKDYKSKHDHYLELAKSGKMTPKDVRDSYALMQAYHPFISQLASMPGVNDNMKTINTTAAAPGLPSPSVAGLGVIQADPLLGGMSQYPAAKGVATRKIGQTKNFPNGKIGVWDGHGWRAQQ